MRLALVPTGAFTRDLKRMARRHVQLEPVEEVLDLIAENSEASLHTLKAHHRMHMLQGYAKALHVVPRPVTGSSPTALSSTSSLPIRA